MEIEDKYLIVATKNGLFKKIKNTYPNCELGDEIEIPDRPRFFDILTSLHSFKVPAGLPLRKVAAVFMIMFFMISGCAVADYMRPVTFVSMDVNLSFELALNRYWRVLTVKGLDEDGEKIAKNLTVKNLPVDEAIKILLNQVNTSENIDSTEINAVMLTISNINDKIPEGLQERLEQTALEETQKLNTQQSIQSTMQTKEPTTDTSQQTLADKKNKPVKIVVKDTTIDKHREAVKNKLSQGKLLIYEKIKEAKPSTTLEEIKSTSLQVLIRELEVISDTKKDQHSRGPNSKEKEQDKGEKEGKDKKENRQNSENGLKKNNNSQRDKAKTTISTNENNTRLNINNRGKESNQVLDRKNKQGSKLKDNNKDKEKDGQKDKDNKKNQDKERGKNKEYDGNKLKRDR